MAVRTESVVIRAVDEFSTSVMKMATAAAVLDKRLDSLDSTNLETRRNIVATSRDTDTLGNAFQRNSANIDKFSGRLSLLAQTAGLLGPSLVPISAIAIPAVTGLAAQLGFAALGAGTLITAFQGVGDAMKAVNTAALEPTAANIEKARQAMKLIGPDAREFVRSFQEFRPVLMEIRDSAAAGWFPGLTESLDHFADVGPQVADIFEKIGRVGGDLVADAAESLASPRWAEFLEFIEAEAPVALEQLGRTVGDLTHGLAELWMAFDPLNDDFAGWLEGVASGFDDWASGLAATAGFQEFVEYLREAGPQVADAMGALANAVLQIAEAAAPLGGPVLQAIEGFANAVAKIADSDLGTPILAGVAAMSAFRLATRAATTQLGALALGQRQITLGFGRIGPAVRTFGTDLNNVARYGTLATDSSKRLQGQLVQFGKSAAVMGGFALAATGAADGIGLTNTASLGLVGTLAGPWGAALGVAGGLMLDVASAGEDLAAATDSARAAMNAWNIDAMTTAMAQLQAEMDDDGFLGIGGFFEDVTGKSARAEQEIAELAATIQYLRDTANQLGGGDALATLLDVGNRLPGSFLDAAHAVGELNAGLEELAGWLDKRAALRGFEESMKELQRSLNAGEINKWAENVDAVGNSLIQVAQHLRGPAKRTFIDETIAGLEKMADKAGPKAAAEVDALIRQLRKLGGTKAEPKVGADDSEFQAKTKRAERRAMLLDAFKANPNLDLDDSAFLRAYGITKKDLEWLDRKTSTPTVNVGGDALVTLGNIAARINGLPKTTDLYVTTHFRTTGSGQGQAHSPNTSADGSTVPDDGRGYSDRFPYLLAPREEVVSNRRGQADSFRGELKDINAGLTRQQVFNRMIARGLADGGTVGLANGGMVGAIPRSHPLWAELDELLRDFLERRRRFLRREGQPASELRPELDELFEDYKQRQRALLKEEGLWAEWRRREMRERVKQAEQYRDELRKDLEAVRDHRNELRDAARSLRQSIAGNLFGNPFEIPEPGEGEAALDPFTAAMQNLKNAAWEATRFENLTRLLKAKGLDGNALQMLLEQASSQADPVAFLTAFSQQSASDLSAFESAFNTANQAAAGAGQAAAFARYGEQLAQANVLLAESRDEYREQVRITKRLEKRQERMERLAEKNPDDTGRATVRHMGPQLANANRKGR